MASLRNRATVGGRRGQAPQLRPLGYSLQASAKQGTGHSLNGRSLGKVLARAAAVRRGFWALELGPNVRLMLDCTRRYIHRYGSDRGDMYFAFGCHSKSITPALLDALRTYHAEMMKTYGDRLGAITYQQAARNLTLR